MQYATAAPGVYVHEVSGGNPISGVGTSTPAFLGLAPQGPSTPTFVANWSEFTRTFGDVQDDMELGRALAAYLDQGGSGCFVVRVGGGDAQTSDTARAALRGPDGAEALVLSAKRSGSQGNEISVEVIDEPVTGDQGGAGDEEDSGGGDEQPRERPTGSPPAPATPFGLVIRGPGGAEERYDDVTVQTLLSRLEASRLVAARAPEGAALGRPAGGQTRLTGGDDGAPLSAEAFLGDEQLRTGLRGLEAVDEVTMVAAPDVVTAFARGLLTEDDVRTVQTAIVDHCERLKDRMAILDPPLFTPGGGGDGQPMSPQEVLAWRDSLSSSKFATLYYPWVQVSNPATRSREARPPSGYAAGAWARNDAERGVSVAPTGRIRSVIGLARVLTDVEQGLLNSRGINCLRVFRGSGPVIWGARTLSDETEWRYLNVRRLLNFIEESVQDGTQFAVFEPNDRALWARVKREIDAFLRILWRDGALVGTTPEEAFYVRCDSETNPDELVRQGIVTIEIGVRPVLPAEFVVIRIQQSIAGTDVTE